MALLFSLATRHTTMKITFILLAGMLAMFSSAVAEDATNRIAFTHAPVSEVLSFYERISGLKLVIDSRVKTITYFTTAESTPYGKEVLMTLVEMELQVRAGIVIARLHDGKTASVTYNDALRLGGFSQ